MMINIFLTLFTIVAVTVGFDDEYTGFTTYPVEHSLEIDGNDVFTRRGTISIRSLKSGSAYFSQDSPLSGEQRRKLRALVESDSVYKVRVPFTQPSNPDTVEYVYTFTKACALYESGLSDLITLNFDLSGIVLGVSISPNVPYCKGEAMIDSDITNFNTTVEVVQTATGPVPETQQYIQKMEAEKKQKEDNSGQDNRSFLAKYWMYIVPLVIFMMFVSNSDQNQGGGGGR